MGMRKGGTLEFDDVPSVLTDDYGGKEKLQSQESSLTFGGIPSRLDTSTLGTNASARKWSHALSAAWSRLLGLSDVTSDLASTLPKSGKTLKLDDVPSCLDSSQIQPPNNSGRPRRSTGRQPEHVHTFVLFEDTGDGFSDNENQCPYREDIHHGVEFGKLFGPQPGIRSFFAADSSWGLTPHDGSPTSGWTMSDSGM